MAEANKWVWRFTRAGVLACMFMVCALAQTAQVTGTIADPSGAVVAGASVVASNIATGVTTSAVSNSSGDYEVTSLIPGTYSISVSAPGFKKVTREGMKLAVDQVARIDFNLEIGATSETVSVTAAAVLLDAETSTLSTVIQNQQITELPLNGRDPIDLVALSPGIRIQGGFGGAGGSWNNFSSNGGLANANSVLVEGLALDLAQMNAPAYVPPVDATQEFRVQTNAFSAENDRTAGAVVNFSIKSGTNQLHGSAYEFLRNKSLDGNDFFQNRAGNPRPKFIENQFGGSFGGPIKKNKTFYFANYEEYRLRNGSPSLTTVPTDLQKQGNFSQTYNTNGKLVLVADPLTTYQLPDGTYTRNLFPGNVIPESRFSTVASHVLKVYPEPNTMGNQLTNVNNFSTFAGGATNQHQIVGKLDHNLSDKWKLFATYAKVWGDVSNKDPLDYIINLTSPNDNDREHATFAATATLTPSLFLELHTGYARYVSNSIPYDAGFDITSLGFPKSLAQQTQFQGFPGFNVDGLVPVGGQPSSGIGLNTLNSWEQRGSVTWMKGNHSLKFGADFRVEQMNQFQSNSLQPAFNFTNQMTALNPLSLDINSGVPFASLLLGNPANASVAKGERLANERRYLAFFVQDDWKITRKLTMNIGTDYSLEFPITERYNRKMWFNPTVPLPVSSAVGIPLYGGFEFANSSIRSPYDLYTKQWGPRLGFAYQLFNKTVIRTGYGLFWIPAAITEVTGDVRAPAWEINTPMVTTLNNGLTPFNTLDNPYPNGLQNPPGNSQGLNTLIGQNAAANQRNFHTGYMQQWNFNIQQELWRGSVLSVAYAGSVGVGLPANWASQMNQLSDSYLSLGSALQTLVPNPFYGIVQTGALAQSQIQRGQLLRPYPQFQTLYVEGDPLGHSNYNSFQLQYNHRIGSSVIGLAYTISKGLGDTESRSDWLENGAQASSMGFMDPNNRRLDRSLNVADTPQRLVISYDVELPLGPGKRMFNHGGLLGRLVSGWELNGIYTAQVGTPVAVYTSTNLTGTYNAVTDVYGSYSSNSRPNNNGHTANLPGSAENRLNEWFNTSVFSQPAPFTYGNTGRTLPDVRLDGINNLDFGAYKNNRFGRDARFNLQFRSEFYNLANHPRFGVPGLIFGTTNFGVVSTQANNPRQIQFAIKLLF
jgi:Carboxypeptidase regulatory-like domain